MDQILFWLVPAASIMALCFAWYFHRQMMKESEGTPQMIKIAAAVRKGAMSYLRQQYKIVGWVFLGLVILFSIMAYGFGVQNSWVPIAFLTGGFFSGSVSQIYAMSHRPLFCISSQYICPILPNPIKPTFIFMVGEY